MSGREVLGLTLDRLQDLPDPCRRCVFWELDPVLGAQARDHGDAELEKESWLSAALLEWGSVGRVVYVDQQPAGYLTYASPGFVPRATLFPTAPVSSDAVLMMAARVWPQFQGQGLGRVLVQDMAKDVLRRGGRAVEAFGGGGGPDAHTRSTAGTSEAPTEGACLVPAEFFTAVGFKTVREHHLYPRLRLDLRTALSWREDMEQAVERLLAQVRSPVRSGRRATLNMGDTPSVQPM